MFGSGWSVVALLICLLMRYDDDLLPSHGAWGADVGGVVSSL